MSVYLGNAGGIEIRRTGEPISCPLAADDIDVSERRFSIDFDLSYDEPRPSPFITGDEVEFRSADEATNLQLVSGITDTSVTRWVHVDQLGGIRLFDSYQQAVNGIKDEALELVTPTENQNIVVNVANVASRCVAQMREWEITTQRETVDMTILGEEYRQQYDQGLISGQGSINAIWDYEFTPCVDTFSSGSELANYFSQLVIRFREGSLFKGYFYVYQSNNESVWYEADCICTSVGMNFTTGDVISSSIQFVTTGQVWLKQGQPPGFLVQEDDNKLELEQPPGSIELEFSA